MEFSASWVPSSTPSPKALTIMLGTSFAFCCALTAVRYRSSAVSWVPVPRLLNAARRRVVAYCIISLGASAEAAIRLDTATPSFTTNRMPSMISTSPYFVLVPVSAPSARSALVPCPAPIFAAPFMMPRPSPSCSASTPILPIPAALEPRLKLPSSSRKIESY